MVWIMAILVAFVYESKGNSEKHPKSMKEEIKKMKKIISEIIVNKAVPYD